MPDVVVVKVTSDGTSAVTKYSDVLTGFLEYIRFDTQSTTPFDATPEFSITGETSGINLWVENNVNIAADTIRAPRYPLHDQVGVAVTYDGTRPIYARIPICQERIKITVTNGGAAGNYGTFYIAYEPS